MMPKMVKAISERSHTNSKAIMSLTFGILALVIPMIGFLLGIVGLVLSIKSTNEIEKRAESGKGLAVAGLICSIVGIVVQLFIILGFVAFFQFTTVQGP